MDVRVLRATLPFRFPGHRLPAVRIRRDQKAELIKNVPLFSRCSRKDLASVASIADEVDLPAGQELTRQGDLGREFFVLVDGTADVTKDGAKVNALGPGDFFGEIALVSQMPRTATVVATSPVRALVMRDQEFRGLMKHSPEIQLKVLEALAERLAPDSL
jgi:CRP/FNR family cyclic AMP-dependent transcriptional regulator